MVRLECKGDVDVEDKIKDIIIKALIKEYGYASVCEFDDNAITVDFEEPLEGYKITIEMIP